VCHNELPKLYLFFLCLFVSLWVALFNVEINCLALSISLDFWFNWLVHAIQYGIRAGGPRIKS
jgi:hypothetical protein